MVENNPLFKFVEAERMKCKASIMLEGLPGRGKTGLALLLGYYLADSNWQDVFLIDTENKSANLLVGIPSSNSENFGKFKVAQLTKEIGFKPTNYTLCSKAAEEAGAKVIIKDSISHAWQYEGGILDMVSQLKARSDRYSKDSYAAWGEESVVKEKNELLALIREDNMHCITTVRVKEKLEYEKDENGKSKLVSLGDQQIQQADLKYEPDLVLQMISPGSNNDKEIKHPIARCVKSRYAIFKPDEIYEFTPELCLQIKDYLENGADPKELLEQQRQEYLADVKKKLGKNETLKIIWDELKKQAGYEEIASKDLPLDIVKKLYIELTAK